MIYLVVIENMEYNVCFSSENENEALEYAKEHNEMFKNEEDNINFIVLPLTEWYKKHYKNK